MELRTNRLALLLAITGLAGLAFSGCSSSQLDEGVEGESIGEEIPAAEADTDAIPEESTETAQAEPEAVPEETQTPADTAQAEPMPETSSGEYEEVRVQAGDTFMKIAFEMYGDLYAWRRIYDLNRDKVSGPEGLKVGTILKIEKASTPFHIEKNGESYLIRHGDTLGSISRDVYGTDSKWKKIWENNRQLIRNPNRIYAGFTLFYVMTPEDQQEKERFQSNQPITQAPAAQPNSGGSLGAMDFGSARSPSAQ